VRRVFTGQPSTRLVDQFTRPLEINSSQTNGGPDSTVKRPIIAFGTMRTGTTLLMDMLSAHPDIFITTGSPEGEDVVMWVELAGALMAGVGKRNAIGPVGHMHCLPMDASAISDERAAFVHQGLLERYPEARRDGIRLLNANTHLGNKLGFVNKIFPDADLIFLTRNPYAVASSLKRKLQQFPNLMFEVPDAKSGCLNVYPRYGWSGLPKAVNMQNPNFFDPDDPNCVKIFARYWKNTVLYIEEQAEALNLPIYKLRYEDLVSNHQDSMDRFLGHCGLSPFSEWKTLPIGGVNEERLSQIDRRDKDLIRDEIGDVIEAYGYEHPE
tara:strand:- start:30671 stop:31645 length:975 start_codon:yes stop_codon:yes gene_type:complete